ncbi:MAG TPA: MFS transporter [Pyrinomonadaceae bacterium]|nr:MFS transporter [Pyrinomonadaceae bacterium]
MTASGATVTRVLDAGESSRNASRSAVYCAAFVALGLTTASLGPTLPGLAAQTHASLGQIGSLFTARSLGFLLGALGAGRLYDRVSGKVLMTASLVLMSGLMALAPFPPALWLLTITMVALGAAEGALDVGGNTLMLWTHGERAGPYMNGLHFFYGVGAFLSPLVVALALRFGTGVSPAYYLLALLVLPAFVWGLQTSAPAAQSISQESQAEATPVGRQLLLVVALFFFLYLGAEVSFGGWIYTYAVTVKLGGAATAAYLTSAFWGALTVGRLLAIPLAARLRPRTILLGALSGCLLSFCLILLTPASTVALWLGTFGVGFSMAPIFPTTFSWAGRRMQITGRVTSWFLAGASAGGMFLPWLAGQLFEAAGARAAMWAVAADLLAALFVFKFLCKDSAELSTNRV